MKTVAIVGAGLAGLTLANQLAAHCCVTVFEKSRGVGGRMATRRRNHFEFDHGAQYFTAKSEGFRSLIEKCLANEIIHPWQFETARQRDNIGQSTLSNSRARYVAAPRMTSLCKALAAHADIRLNTEIVRLERDNGKWQLEAKTGEHVGLFDWVVSTAPAPQTKVLMPSDFADFAALDKAKMSACFSLMLGFNEPIDIVPRGQIYSDSPIGWVAVNSSKPLRRTALSIIAQTTNDWAEQHIDGDRIWIMKFLKRELEFLVRADLPEPAHIDLHRWRYAGVVKPAGKDHLLDEQLNLGACGDWCVEGRVEGAFLSGLSLSAKLKSVL